MKENTISLKNIFALCIIFSFFANTAISEEITTSFHGGFMDPNGVDIVGYTVQTKINDSFYRYYTFGLPSLVAVGLNYYDNYQGDGITGTLGIGIGSILYGSLAYQVNVKNTHYLKLGAGYTSGIAYSGLYPVLSYEIRFY
ncbi:MAG: hypothetical protein NTY39_01065 [Campylobacterales bacterium]|nr:hypothetical protein [Campylobacterales bacterium]